MGDWLYHLHNYLFHLIYSSIPEEQHPGDNYNQKPLGHPLVTSLALFIFINRCTWTSEMLKSPSSLNMETSLQCLLTLQAKVGKPDGGVGSQRKTNKHLTISNGFNIIIYSENSAFVSCLCPSPQFDFSIDLFLQIIIVIELLWLYAYGARKTQRLKSNENIPHSWGINVLIYALFNCSVLGHKYKTLEKYSTWFETTFYVHTISSFSIIAY